MVSYFSTRYLFPNIGEMRTSVHQQHPFHIVYLSYKEPCLFHLIWVHFKRYLKGDILSNGTSSDRHCSLMGSNYLKLKAIITVTAPNTQTFRTKRRRETNSWFPCAIQVLICNLVILQYVNQSRPGQYAGTGYRPNQIVRHSPQIQNAGQHQINQVQGTEYIQGQRAINRGNPSLQTLHLPQQRYADQNNWREQETFGHHQQQSTPHPPQHSEFSQMIQPMQNMYIQQQYQPGNASHLNTLTSNPGFLNFGQQMQHFPSQQTVFPSSTRTDQNTRSQYSQFSQFDRPLVPRRFEQSQRARFQPPASHHTYIPYPAYSAPPVPRILQQFQNVRLQALGRQQFSHPMTTHRYLHPIAHAGQNPRHQVTLQMSHVTEHIHQPSNTYPEQQTSAAVYSNPAAIWNTHQLGASQPVRLPHMSNKGDLSASHPAQRGQNTSNLSRGYGYLRLPPSSSPRYRFDQTATAARPRALSENESRAAVERSTYPSLKVS